MITPPGLTSQPGWVFLFCFFASRPDRHWLKKEPGRVGSHQRYLHQLDRQDGGRHQSPLGLLWWGGDSGGSLPRPSGHITGPPLITSCHIDEKSLKEGVFQMYTASCVFTLPPPPFFFFLYCKGTIKLLILSSSMSDCLIPGAQ